MEQTADALLPAARVAVLAAFGALTLIAAFRAQRTGAAGRWVAAAFGAMSLSLLLSWVPDLLGMQLPGWTNVLGLLLIVAFPYLLLRFSASFVDLPSWLEVTAAVLAVLASVAIAVSATLPVTSGWEHTYLLVALAYWLPVSMVSVVRLWHAGRDQPTVARRRMRMMSVGASVLVVAVFLAVRGPATSMTALVVDGFALLSALALGMGFLPPRSLRAVWRQPEEEKLRAATVGVLRARSLEGVTEQLLPPIVGMIDASGAAMAGPDGSVVASFADAPAVGEQLSERDDEHDGATRRLVMPLGEGQGDLIVWTGPYAPFFGQEDTDLLRSMAAIAELAIERCEMLGEERARSEALQQAHMEAERAREEAHRANTAKSAFLSRMSHELRTPLNAILGFGQLLETSPLQEDDEEAVSYILKAGRHLLALINDVLDLSRIEAGIMTVSLEPVHVTELIQDSLALVQVHAASRSIRLEFDPDSVDAHVMTDRQRSRQALLNLLSNAVKYNHDGGSVAVDCTRLGDGMLRISIRDTGPGIDPGRQQLLFEPFERLGAESSGIEGTGLGLALSRQLIERIGGEIGVDSAPGQGSTFWIDLPMTEQVDEDEESEETASSTGPVGERTLLLVEDNLASLRLVESMLRRRPGMSVVAAMQGRLALELAESQQPDVIVLDLHLPDLSGQEVLHRLRSSSTTRHIPVIVASADATPRRVREMRQIGAAAYITKPLDVREFLETLDAAVTGMDCWDADSGADAASDV